MKEEKVLELLKQALPEDVDVSKVDVKSITKEWNDSINGAIKAETEKAKDKTESELIKSFGFESADELSKALEAKKEKEQNELSQVDKLSKELEGLKADMQKKDAVLLETKHKSLLKGANIREDRIDQAYRLIKDDITEEADINEVIKKFVETTPEFLDNTNNQSITTDDKHKNEGELKTEAETLEGAW